MTPEKKVQNSIINYLKELQKQNYRIFYERRQAGGFSYKKGISDLYMIFNGKHIEIEVKSETGKLSIMQEKWRDKCKSLNISWICISSVSQFIEFIKSLPEFTSDTPVNKTY